MLAVRSNVRLGVTPHLMSAPPSFDTEELPSDEPTEANGLMVRLRPDSILSMPSNVPALDILWIRPRLGSGAQ